MTPRPASVAALAVALLTLLVVTQGLGLARLERTERDRVVDDLTIVLRTTQRALGAWAERESSAVDRIGADTALARMVSARDGATTTDLPRADIEARLDDDIGEGAPVALLGPDGTVLAGRGPTPVGAISPLATRYPARFASVFEGSSAWIPPVADAPESDQRQAVYAVAPLTDTDGVVVAAVAARFDLVEDFSPQVRLGRLGASGEIYAIDESGRIVSESRFPAELRSSGLVRGGATEVGRMRVSDPGGDLLGGFTPPEDSAQWPLTVMAASVARGESGRNADGYRDYRGIEVLGAWQWDDRLGVGLAAEMDEDEALSAFRTTRTIVLGLVAVGMLFTLLAVLSTGRLRRTVTALEASRERILRSSPAVLGALDADDLRVSYVNDAFGDVTGVPPSEAIGKTLDELGLVSDGVRALIGRARAEDKTDVEGVEVPIVRRDGIERRLLVSAELVSDTELDGSSRIYFAATDVTERRATERALAERERFLRTVVGTMGEGIVVMSSHGEYLVANPAAEEALGVAMGEDGRVLMEQFDPFLRPDGSVYDPADWPASRTLRSGEAIRGEVLGVRRKGEAEVRWFCINTRTMREAGEVTGVVVTFEDVTDERAALQALTQSEEKFAAAFHSSSDGLVVTRLSDGTVLEINEAMLEIVGRPRKDVLGSRRIPLDLLGDRFTPLRIQERVRAEGGVRSVELRIRGRDGRVRDIVVSARAFDSDGQRHVLWNFRDISYRTKVERELRASRESLREISRQLIEVQETERGRLARELHDEIGQSLTALKLQLQAMLRAKSSDRLPEMIGEGLEVVDDTIDEVRRLASDLRPSALDDLGLEAGLRWYVSQWGERAGVAADFSGFLPSGPRSEEMETVCFRIAQEALTNVARHARATQVNVRILQRGDRVLLTIEDDGDGFRTTNRFEGRRGLRGMSERAELIGGIVRIESAPGEGTTITAELPTGIEHGEPEPRRGMDLT